MNNMKCVPVDILTGKDVDYLSDMFQWNYVAFKKGCNDIESLNSQDLIDLFGRITDFFEENLNMVIDILDNPGGEVHE